MRARVRVCKHTPSHPSFPAIFNPSDTGQISVTSKQQVYLGFAAMGVLTVAYGEEMIRNNVVIVH